MKMIVANYIKDNLGSAEYFLTLLLTCIDREAKRSKGIDRKTWNAVHTKVVAARTRVTSAVKKLEEGME